MGLALSCVLAGFALCLRTDNLLLRAYEFEGVSGVFVLGFLLGATALSVLVYFSAHDEEKRRWSIGVGLAAALGGVLCALLLQLLPGALSAGGAGVLLGFGLTCLLRQWGRYYRLFSYRGALLNTMVALLAASCWWFVVAHAGTPFLFCLGLLVLVLCGALPLMMRQIIQADEVKPDASDPDRLKPPETMRQVMRRGWAAVTGLMINFFALGLALWPREVGTAPITPKPLAYLLLALVLWVAVARPRRAAGGVLSLFYRVALPLAAAVALVRPLVETFGFPVDALALSLGSYTGVALFNVLGLVVLFWTAKSSEVGFSKVFAVFCVSCALSLAAGVAAFHLFGDDTSSMLACLLGAYLAAMLAAELVRAIRRPPRRQDPAGGAEGLFDSSEGGS